jgi:hypothetical protein
MRHRLGGVGHQLPAQIVMSADDLVDAALSGLDLGDTATIKRFSAWPHSKPYQRL